MEKKKKKRLTKITEKQKKTKSEIFNKLKDKTDLTYSDIHDLVEYLVETNAYKYTFDGFTSDDIGQEIRKKCFLLLNKWNGDKAKQSGNPVWFFGVSIQNHLKNLRRDNSIKSPNYNPDEKFQIKAVASLNDSAVDIGIIDNNIDFYIMSDEVRERLNKIHRKHYDKMIESLSIRGIPSNIRTKIFDVMKEVMGEDESEISMNFSQKRIYSVPPQKRKDEDLLCYQLQASGMI